MPPIIKGTIKVFVNFKALKFTKELEADTAVFDIDPDTTPNNLIKQVIDLVYQKFDKKFLINKSDALVYMLKDGDKEDYIAGEEPLYCWEVVSLAIQLRKDLKFKLVEKLRQEIAEGTYPVQFNTEGDKFELSSQPDQNIILWHFPADSKIVARASSAKATEEQKREAVEEFKRQFQLRTYDTVVNIPNVFTSNEVRQPYCIRLLKIENMIVTIKKEDLIKDTYEKKRFGPLQAIDSKIMFDDRPPTEGQGFNSMNSNTPDFIKSLFKENQVVRSNRPLPLVFFVNARLFHGPLLLDSSTNILVPMRNSNELFDNLMIFKTYSIDKIPLEARIIFEISSLYNNSYLKKLGTCCCSVFDCAGLLRTGTRVDSDYSRDWLSSSWETMNLLAYLSRNTPMMMAPLMPTLNSNTPVRLR